MTACMAVVVLRGLGVAGVLDDDAQEAAGHHHHRAAIASATADPPDLPGAIRSFRTACRVAPGTAAYYADIGTAYLRAGNINLGGEGAALWYGRSRQAFEHSLALRPEHQDTMNSLMELERNVEDSLGYGFERLSAASEPLPGVPLSGVPPMTQQRAMVQDVTGGGAAGADGGSATAPPLDVPPIIRERPLVQDAAVGGATAADGARETHSEQQAGPRWRGNRYSREGGILPYQMCGASSPSSPANPAVAAYMSQGESHALFAFAASVWGASSPEGKPLQVRHLELLVYWTPSSRPCPRQGVHCRIVANRQPSLAGCSFSFAPGATPTAAA